MSCTRQHQRVLLVSLGFLVASVAHGEPHMDTLRQRLVESFCMMDMAKYGVPHDLWQNQKPDGSWADVDYDDQNGAKWLAHPRKNPNRWWNEIGVPKNVGVTMLRLGHGPEPKDANYIYRVEPVSEEYAAPLPPLSQR